MLKKIAHATLLSSVAAFALSTAQAQTSDQADATADAEACVTLAERLSDDVEVEANLRTEVEDVIASGNVVQCQMVITAWEQEGTITRESLELVATESASQRMIVQQEVEVDADVAVYQPPAEVGVDTGTPEVNWTMPRQSVTVEEPAPEIVIRQGQPTVNVEVPQVRVNVMIPEPEVIVTWPDSTIDMSELQPNIEVRIPEPTVTVNMPDPVIDLTIGGDGPDELVELEDGRFAPPGATAEDLEPRINIQQGEATITRAQEAEEAEVVFNRGEPMVTYEAQEPEVTVNVVGEPEIRVSTGASAGMGNDGTNAAMPDNAAEGDMDGAAETPAND